MALITLPSRHLHLRAALPFGVYDANGMLMLASGTPIEAEAQLQVLRSKALFVEESDAHEWLAQANRTVQSLMLHDAPIQQIAVARWRDDAAAALTRTSLGRAGMDRGSKQHRSSALDITISVVERWEGQMQQVTSLLRDGQRDSGWLERLYLAVTISNSLAESHSNEVLFLMIQHAMHETRHYSSHHAALCAVICTRVATALKWPDDEVQALSLAAITMNLSMTTLQDRLAMQKEAPTHDQRAQIQSHAIRSASELAAIGVRDPRWLKVVRLHHDRGVLETPLAQLDASSRLARLLGVVDRFTAKVSRRASRSPMSPLAAARDACVGPDGRPDELGSALLKTLGMYPPGSYVQLATGEIGVVLARGTKANEPMVAALVGASGQQLAEPVLRDTSRSGRAVTGAVAVADVRVRVHHEKLLDLI